MSDKRTNEIIHEVATGVIVFLLGTMFGMLTMPKQARQMTDEARETLRKEGWMRVEAEPGEEVVCQVASCKGHKKCPGVRFKK